MKQPAKEVFAKRLAWLCGSSTANVNPEIPVPLDLQKLSGIISRNHSLLLSTPMVLVFMYDGHEVSLFKKGRMLIKNVQSEEEAIRVYKSVAGIVGVK